MFTLGRKAVLCDRQFVAGSSPAARRSSNASAAKHVFFVPGIRGDPLCFFQRLHCRRAPHLLPACVATRLKYAFRTSAPILWRSARTSSWRFRARSGLHELPRPILYCCVIPRSRLPVTNVVNRAGLWIIATICPGYRPHSWIGSEAPDGKLKSNECNNSPPRTGMKMNCGILRLRWCQSEIVLLCFQSGVLYQSVVSQCKGDRIVQRKQGRLGVRRRCCLPLRLQEGRTCDGKRQ